MSSDFKLPFFKMYERVSARGATYFTARLGDVKLVIFREEDTAEDELFGARARWQAFAVSGEQPRRQTVEGRQRPALRLYANEK